MQDALFEMEKQFKHERVITRSRYLRVKEMEQKVLQFGKNPQDYSRVKQIMDEKNKEITALKRKLKDLKSYQVQTPKLISSTDGEEQHLNQLQESKQWMEEFQNRVVSL